MDFIPPRLVALELAISEVFEVPIAHIRGTDRARECSEVRQFTWAMAYQTLGYTYNRIAQIYVRDHTTIRYGVVRALKKKSYKDNAALIRERISKSG